MIVPEFWAEARQQGRIGSRQVTVRRWGWSDVSQQEAQAHAETRAAQAFSRLEAGESLARRELKRSYNGAEGVPIREEIISRHGDTVITRNIYGARCLNTPDVLFADIDFAYEPALRAHLLAIASLLPIAVLVGAATQSWRLGGISLVLSLFLGPFLARGLHRLWMSAAGGAEQQALTRVQSFSDRHPDWHLRVYRTPGGLRVLVMHRTFAADESAVAEFFRALDTDPIYVRMCLHQRCFRARVSAKPWRAGIEKHILPRPGVWPINPVRLPERLRWVTAYEQTARRFAACHFLTSLGSKVVHPAAQSVQQLHDELCQANSSLPLA